MFLVLSIWETFVQLIIPMTAWNSIILNLHLISLLKNEKKTSERPVCYPKPRWTDKPPFVDNFPTETIGVPYLVWKNSKGTVPLLQRSKVPHGCSRSLVRAVWSELAEHCAEKNDWQTRCFQAFFSTPGASCYNTLQWRTIYPLVI